MSEPLSEIAKQAITLAMKIGGAQVQNWFHAVANGETPDKSLTEEIKSLMPERSESEKVAAELEAKQASP